MIKIEKVSVYGFEEAIRGMRNPMNSWNKSDSYTGGNFVVGPNDHQLMMKLATGGPVHAKYRRMITVYADITAPLYWWKEFDTYKVGTVANSCSTMHKIHAKEFSFEDFSHEHLLSNGEPGASFDYSCVVRNPENRNELVYGECVAAAMECLKLTIDVLNTYRMRYLRTKNKLYWWQMIQLLPSSYNQLRTVVLNYEVLAGIYPMRKSHKLDEWQEVCRWIEQLPYSEIITCDKELLRNSAKDLRVETPLGALIVRPSCDSEHSGVWIDLRRTDADDDMPLALVEFSSDDNDLPEGQPNIITRVWGNGGDESYTDRIVHQGIEDYFKIEEETQNERHIR